MRTARVIINYFKESGKWYTNSLYTIDGENTFHEAVEIIRKLNAENKLPGLQSGNWNGPILVEYKWVQHLIL